MPPVDANAVATVFYDCVPRKHVFSSQIILRKFSSFHTKLKGISSIVPEGVNASGLLCCVPKSVAPLLDLAAQATELL